MRFFTILMLALFLLTGSLQAEQIYVLFDGACGDRVKYEQTVARQPRLDYYAYHFSFQGGDRLMLETGTEGTTIQNYLPQGYVYCGDPRLNLELANRINGGVDQVFILLPTANNQYLIQPVMMASVLQRRGERFAYYSTLAGYEFDAENGIAGENLSVGNDGAKVYFEGRETSPCDSYFLFRQLKPGASYPVIDYKVSPEIGIYERRLGSDGVNTSGGIIIAREVNGVPVTSHLASLCNNSNAMTGRTTPTGQAAGPTPTVPAIQQPGRPGAYGNQRPAPSYSADATQPESRAYASQQPPATTATSITHTVVKGETLYAVSRMYGSSVDAIMARNGLTSNVLFPGQRLLIDGRKAPVIRDAVVSAPTVPTVPYNAGPVANSNPGAAQPTPYGTVSAPAKQAYGSPAATDVRSAMQTARSGQTAVYGEDVHMVQPGETVASIALKYGYTSARFREINAMGANDIVKVGQQLKTSNCNCPATAPVAPQPREAAPAVYGQQSPAVPRSYSQPATPDAFGNQQPAASRTYSGQQPVAPRVYGQSTDYPQGTSSRDYGNQQPAPTATAAYRTPEGYRAPPAAPVPAQATPTAPASTMINNNPNFGQVVPNTSAPASTSLDQLESRGTRSINPVPAPAAYNNYSTPALTPDAYEYRTPQPTPYPYNTAPLPTSNPYGTAPQSANSYEYSAPQPVTNAYGTTTASNKAQVTPPAANVRSFHLVQEGENLYSIARSYGLTTAQLRALNNLDNGSVIIPFQKLYVN